MRCVKDRMPREGQFTRGINQEIDQEIAREGVERSGDPINM